MAKVEGAKELERTLIKLSKDTEGNVNVRVGYTANYALIVHEDMEAKHPNGGNAKYLEKPFRELDLFSTILKVIKKKGSLRQALTIAGLRLQRASQKQVPVDTSFLKASAFTKSDKKK